MKLTVILFLSFISIGLYSQDTLTVMQSQDQDTVFVVQNKRFTLTSSLDRITNSVDLPTPSVLRQRSIFDAKKLPIFCKFEHKLAKSSNVNVMMRLGSLDYVNKLEGKTP